MMRCFPWNRSLYSTLSYGSQCPALLSVSKGHISSHDVKSVFVLISDRVMKSVQALVLSSHVSSCPPIESSLSSRNRDVLELFELFTELIRSSRWEKGRVLTAAAALFYYSTSRMVASLPASVFPIHQNFFMMTLMWLFEEREEHFFYLFVSLCSSSWRLHRNVFMLWTQTCWVLSRGRLLTATSLIHMFTWRTDGSSVAVTPWL